MSLRPNDLEGLVLKELSIDEFQSKLGEDRDVVVVAIPVKEESAAHDLGDFVERGPFDVWDIDVSPAPGSDGNYVVFIELERSHLMWNTLKNILEHTERITSNAIESITFTCPGHQRPQDLSEEAFKSYVLQSPYRWDIAHDVYPEVPDPEELNPSDVSESISKRMRFLAGY
jgi:hypothetical protein